MNNKSDLLRRKLNKLSTVHDTLATASTPQDAKNNIAELQLLENILNQLETEILDLLGSLEREQRTLQEQSTSGGLLSILPGFKRKPTAEQDRGIRELGLQMAEYQNQLLFARAIRTVARTATIPQLYDLIQTQKPKKTTQSLDYYHYINSPEWRAKAEEAKARSNNRCQICNKSRAQVQLDTHHRTYERLGHELPEDVTVLCRNCHQLYEDERRLEKPTKKCQTCGRNFAPLKPSHPQCLDCFLSSKNRQTARPPAAARPTATSSTPITTCKRCGKEFVQAKATYHYCYDCYKQYRHR